MLEGNRGGRFLQAGELDGSSELERGVVLAREGARADRGEGPGGVREQQPAGQTCQGEDTSYYDVWSPSPSRPAGGTWPVDQKHDLNLTGLT